MVAAAAEEAAEGATGGKYHRLIQPRAEIRNRAVSVGAAVTDAHGNKHFHLSVSLSPPLSVSVPFFFTVLLSKRLLERPLSSSGTEQPI